MFNSKQKSMPYIKIHIKGDKRQEHYSLC
uniref:Uncharacterized protein n=1 Tax=Arundo donax TaxID=35708 RepID=A0A0A9C0G7_ARUDO